MRAHSEQKKQPIVNNQIPNIWQMQNEDDTAGLAKALQHESPDIRRRAAAALRIIGKTDVIDDLKQALETEKDDKVQQAIHAAIEHLLPQESVVPEEKTPQTRVERLIEHLMGNQPDLSIQAANALSELNDKTSIAPLITLFRNQRRDPKVRLAAAEALLKMNSAPAEVTLLAALRSEKSSLRRNGAAILGQIQAEWAVIPLAIALYDKNEVVAKTARAALRRIGTPDARKALQEAKRALLETGDLDAHVLRRAKKIEKERLSKNVKLPSPPTKIEQVVEKQQKVETSKLKPPKKKPETGTLKQVIPELNEVATAPVASKSVDATRSDLNAAETKKPVPKTDTSAAKITPRRAKSRRRGSNNP